MANGAGEVQQEVISDKVETVKEFYYLGNRLTSSGGCKAAVTEITRLGWKKFREGGVIPFGKILFEDEMIGMKKLCKMRFVIWKRNVVF